MPEPSVIPPAPMPSPAPTSKPPSAGCANASHNCRPRTRWALANQLSTLPAYR